MEHGFWDYTCYGAGGMEQYQMEDYIELLEDMEKAGMDSLAIIIRWMTTGYNSSLPFVEKIKGTPVCDSDNQLLRDVIKAAQNKGIKVYLGACLMVYDAKLYGYSSYTIYSEKRNIPGYGIYEQTFYDTDIPGFGERSAMIFQEIVELFPGISGLIVELENTNIEAPHRIPLYNEWAKKNDRRPFEKLGHPLSPRCFDTICSEWRDYTTYSRMSVLKKIDDAVRSSGFTGDMFMICETGQYAYSAVQEINLKDYHVEFPCWKAVTYEYNKMDHRYAMMDLCVDSVKKEGMEVFYLPRGVMTWGWQDKPYQRKVLESSWDMDVEDILQFKPNGVWWFGSGSKNNGDHVRLSGLKSMGYKNGTDARRTLLEKASVIKVK